MNDDLNYDNQMRVSRQEKRISDLEKFVKKFIDNFEDCTVCDNQLGLDAAGQECYRCKGTGKQIDSVGVLYVELPDEAAELLKVQS